MLDFSNHAWDVEIDAAVINLKRHGIKDHDYWWDTIDVVESGFDPSTKKPITTNALSAWVTRCKTQPTQKDSHYASTPRIIRPSY